MKGTSSTNPKGGEHVVGSHLLVRFVAAVSMFASMGLVATGLPAGASTKAPTGGVVTFAEQPGTPPTAIFPVVNGSESSNSNTNYFQPLMWLPLFWFGSNTNRKMTVNYTLSIGQKPQFSNSGRTLTVTLNHYSWSTGAPVSARDLVFWMNLITNEKTNVFFYSPGGWMTHITSFSAPTANTFVITFSKTYNPTYILDSVLSTMIPLPQQAWDKTSASSPVGNYDTTPSGAKQVYKYLHGQSAKLSTWDTNPLWQVVDGPWHLQPNTGFQVTGEATLIPNPAYSGTNKPKISEFKLLPFTSAAAEYNALRSGAVDFGYIPTTDVGTIGSIKSSGFKVAPWYAWGLTWITINYSNPKYGPLVKQLYLRQAMESLIDQPTYVKSIMAGYGVPTYGPVPLSNSSVFLTPAAKRNPYPYNPKKAKQLLVRHGWSIPSQGVGTCTKPGTGARECGAGIAKGTKLQLPLLYSTGTPVRVDEVQALKTSFRSAGIDLSIKAGPLGTVATAAYACAGKSPKKCPASSPELTFVNSPSYSYEPVYYPTGATVYTCGAVTDGGNYCNPKVDHLIDVADTELTSTKALSAYAKFEALVAKELPFLWMPSKTYQLSALSPKLGGATNQAPNVFIYPSTWTMKS